MANLLIIDPQIDFHEGGSLAVPGATADSDRIIKFIETNHKRFTDKLNKIFVSLDTHTKQHIGHAGFWNILLMPDGNKINPYLSTITLFKDKIKLTEFVDPIKEPEKVPNTIIINPKEETLIPYIKWYLQQLQDNGKKHMIWPDHCLEDSDGHKVYGPLKIALDNFKTEKGGDSVEYHIKGQNCLTEMYSIMGSEVDIKEYPYFSNIKKYQYLDGSLKDGTNCFTDNSKNCDKDKSPKCKSKESTFSTFTSIFKSEVKDCEKVDHVYLDTNFNQTLFDSLTNGVETLFICGEALSHCVMESTKHIIEKIKKMGLKIKVVLLDDCTSPIPGTDKIVNDFYKYIDDNNTIIKREKSVFDEDKYYTSTNGLTNGGKTKKTKKTNNGNKIHKKLNIGGKSNKTNKTNKTNKPKKTHHNKKRRTNKKPQ